MSRRLSVAVASAAATAVLLGVAPAAQAHEVCARRAALYDTPGGLVVGFVYFRDDVSIIRRSPDHAWVRVRASQSTRGWMRSKALC